MTGQKEEHVIEATGLKHGTVMVSDTLFFTGGLIAQSNPDGTFTLLPLRGASGIHAIPDLSWPQVRQLTSQSGSRLVGSNQEIFGTGPMVTEIWRPSLAPAPSGLFSAESWGAISHQARNNADAAYEECARSLSVSLQAAGIRLRGVSKGHHNQLCWALLEEKTVGAGFSNLPLLDLYLDFHSLATELCAARDYLARTAALTVGAKDSVDGMARLDDWLSKPINSASAKNPLVALLLDSWGSKETPGWLRKLGDIRNQMVHKQPMAANPEAAMLRLVETNTPAGPIPTIRLAPSISSGLPVESSPDPFVVLLDFYNRVEQLARAASELARYKPEPLNVHAT